MLYGRGLQIFHKQRSSLNTVVPGGDAIQIPSEDSRILGCHTKFSRPDALSPGICAPLFCRLMHCLWYWYQWHSYEFVWLMSLLFATCIEAVSVLCVMLHYLVYVGQHFRGTYQNHLPGRSALKMEVSNSSKTVKLLYQITHTGISYS
jgi:hypothetical protein